MPVSKSVSSGTKRASPAADAPQADSARAATVSLIRFKHILQFFELLYEVL